MGNVLRLLYGQCCKPTADYDAAGYHGVTATVGVLALAQDLYDFEITSQVPQGLSKHVVSSKKAQANWYRKLSEAWRETKPPPQTPEEASRLVILTLKGHKKADVEGLLTFYGLPLPHILVELTSDTTPPSRPQGLKFELYTLPIDAKAVADGDTITAYVSTTDPRESAIVPREVQVAADQRSKARARKNYDKADELHRKIIDLGYRVIPVQNHEVLARKYRIRLRGIDTPESKMDYGPKAKEEMANIVRGKCLRALVFDEDRYGRFVADVYCDGIFVQESMLKKGLAWHYKAYDQRPELDKWEKEARAKRVGLWAASNPQMPSEWRKNKREGR